MYTVEVEYSNGNVNVKRAKDYKQGLEIYKATRERHKDTEAVITFKANDTIVWQKKCSILKKPLEDVLQEYRDELCRINQLIKHYQKMQGVTDKEISNIMHRLVENNIDPSNSEKVEVYDYLKETQMLRREYKQQTDLMRRIASDLDNTIASLEKTIKQTKNSKKVFNRQRHNAQKSPHRQHKIHRYRYKNEEEQNKMLRQLRNKYTRVAVDQTSKQILCYNNCAG